MSSFFTDDNSDPVQQSHFSLQFEPAAIVGRGYGARGGELALGLGRGHVLVCVLDHHLDFTLINHVTNVVVPGEVIARGLDGLGGHTSF